MVPICFRQRQCEAREKTSMSASDVVTMLKHVVRGEKSTFYAGDRDKSYWPGEDHQVTIHNMRPIRDQLALEENGFVLVDEATDVTAFDDENEKARYSRQCEALVQRLTGAQKVISFGAIVRTSASGTHGHNQPAFGAHVDYGARTVADYTHDRLPEAEAAQRLAGRHMLLNVWRPLAKVESTPFAVADASTIRREDLFDSEIIGGLGGVDRSLWGFNLAYAPGQRWYWAPDMQPTEALVFKLFDSDPDAVQFTAHTAFEHPDTSENAKPRVSIELRTIAFLAG